MFGIYTVAKRREGAQPLISERKAYQAMVTNNNPVIVPPSIFHQMTYFCYLTAWGVGRDELLANADCREKMIYTDDDYSLFVLFWVDQEPAMRWIANPPQSRLSFSENRGKYLDLVGYDYDPEWHYFIVPEGSSPYDLTASEVMAVGKKLA